MTLGIYRGTSESDVLGEETGESNDWVGIFVILITLVTSTASHKISTPKTSTRFVEYREFIVERSVSLFPPTTLGFCRCSAIHVLAFSSDGHPPMAILSKYS